MLVKVTQCSKPTFWYANYIGRSFNVIDGQLRRIYKHSEAWNVYIDKPTDTRGFILKADCVIADDFITQQAQTCWEVVNKQLQPDGVNPYAFVLGFRYGFEANK
jgi:hypothetical protein